MKRTTLGWVGVCALAFATAMPALALACPDGDGKRDGQDKTPSPSLLCPGDDKKPGEH